MAVKKNQDIKVEVTVPKNRTEKEDLEEQIKAMKADLEKKMEGSAQHFKATCDVVCAKYKTVNGFMQAYEAVKETVVGEYTYDDRYLVYMECVNIAEKMAAIVTGVSAAFTAAFDKGEIIDLQETVEDFDPMFTASVPEDEFAVAEQLVVCNVMQGLGGLLEDMREFKAHADDEIAKLEAELEAL